MDLPKAYICNGLNSRQGDGRMKGAIVFLVVFAIALVLTLGNTAIPPGKAIYDAFLHVANDDIQER